MQEDILVQITNKLKDIRKEKNITLQELAEAAGVTKGMLSQVENNRTIPSLTVFLNIIKSLHVDINDFFQDFNTGQPGKVIFKKAVQYQPFQKENTIGFHYQRIMSSTIDEYHVDFVLLTLMPDAQRAPVQTDAFEFKYILKGKVEYTIGEEVFMMEAGDSIFLMPPNLTILEILAIRKPNCLFYIYSIPQNNLAVSSYHKFTFIKLIPILVTISLL